MIFAELDLDIAAVGDLDGALHRSRAKFEPLHHLVGGFYIELIGVDLQPVGFVNGLAGLNAEQDIVGVIIGALAIMAVIGRHHRNRRILGQLDEQSVDFFLLGQLVVLNLDVIAVAEDRRVLFDGELGLLIVTVVERRRHFALQTGAQRNQSAVKLLEQLFIDARLVVESFGVTQGHQLAQIAVALVVHGQ